MVKKVVRRRRPGASATTKATPTSDTPPVKVTPAVDEETRKETDPLGTAPEAVFEEKVEKDTPVVEVTETFFSKHPSGFDPGKAADGTVLNNRQLYCSDERDADGTPIEYRWGSRRTGFPERNKAKGYVPARVNSKARLDADGKQVEVGGMVLLVRKKEHGDFLRGLKQKEVERYTKKDTQAAMADGLRELKDRAASLGLEDALSVDVKEVERVYEPRKE